MGKATRPLTLFGESTDDAAESQRWTNTHTQRWQRAKQKVGVGPRYQGRFQSFPVESDDRFYAVVRYVERNALRAALVPTAEAWRWGSLGRRVHNQRQPRLSDWPVPEPGNWVPHVNQPQREAELAALRRGVQRGSPFGGDAWTSQTARTLGRTSTLRPRGRPTRAPAG